MYESGFVAVHSVCVCACLLRVSVVFLSVWELMCVCSTCVGGGGDLKLGAVYFPTTLVGV